MEIFKGLQPELVWSYFEEICKIPRPSKKEEKIAAWLMEFAKKHQLEARQDEAGNVLITKPATPGKEQTPGVVLQAHMDMVCEKNADTVHDFDKDPIKPYIDGEWVKAKGTTLGADDGIGIAAALAVLTDENIEILRDSCIELRDVAMIDLLSSTGMRVGELVKMNRDDIDFQERQCVVFGKGNKEREVYFNARAKIHLKKYLNSRNDDNPALFVSLKSPHRRLTISGVEVRLRKIGRIANIAKVHPHKFRRSLATMAIDKGMPIEQVQKILGHSQIDTTMQYAIVNQNNVKVSHRRYIA